MQSPDFVSASLLLSFLGPQRCGNHRDGIIRGKVVSDLTVERCKRNEECGTTPPRHAGSNESPEGKRNRFSCRTHHLAEQSVMTHFEFQRAVLGEKRTIV